MDSMHHGGPHHPDSWRQARDQMQQLVEQPEGRAASRSCFLIPLLESRAPVCHVQHGMRWYVDTDTSHAVTHDTYTLFGRPALYVTFPPSKGHYATWRPDDTPTYESMADVLRTFLGAGGAVAVCGRCNSKHASYDVHVSWYASARSVVLVC